MIGLWFTHANNSGCLHAAALPYMPSYWHCGILWDGRTTGSGASGQLLVGARLTRLLALLVLVLISGGRVSVQCAVCSVQPSIPAPRHHPDRWPGRRVGVDSLSQATIM